MLHTLLFAKSDPIYVFCFHYSGEGDAASHLPPHRLIIGQSLLVIFRNWQALLFLSFSWLSVPLQISVTTSTALHLGVFWNIPPKSEADGRGLFGSITSPTLSDWPLGARSWHFVCSPCIGRSLQSNLYPKCFQDRKGWVRFAASPW